MNTNQKYLLVIIVGGFITFLGMSAQNYQMLFFGSGSVIIYIIGLLKLQEFIIPKLVEIYVKLVSKSYTPIVEWAISKILDALLMQCFRLVLEIGFKGGPKLKKRQVI